MPLPQLLRQDVDEADAVIDRALVERIGAEETVDVVGAQIGHHFRRRHRADLDVLVGVDAVLGDVIAQEIIVHGVVEGHRELEAFPDLRIVLVLVLGGERNGLAVDVLDRRHGVGHRVRAGTERDRQRHRREHMGGVVFLVERLVADDGPAGGLDHLHVQSVLAVEAHGMGHDDRRGAGDRDESDLEILLLDRAALRAYIGRGLEREKLRERGERGRRADRFEERAARGVLRKHGAHHRRRDHALVALVFALDLRALERQLRVVLGLAAVAPAPASRPIESALGIEGVVEGRHGGALRRFAGGPHRRRCTN